MKARIAAAAACCAGITALLICSGSAVNAHAADVNDVYQAMRDVGTTEELITTAKTQYRNTVHDENGMEMSGTYRTYDEWVTLIHENGVQYIVSVIAEEYCVDPQDIIDYYAISLPGGSEDSEAAEAVPFTPSVQPEKPFAEMTQEEKKAYIASLPYEERVAFLATLSPADRKSIYQQLSDGQKTDIAAGMADFGREIGLYVSVDDIQDGTPLISVHDKDGKLIDKTALGLVVDPTGWDTTVPVLTAGSAVLLSAAGLLLFARRFRKEDQDHE